MHTTLKTGFTIVFVLFMVLSASANAETVQSYYDLGVFAFEAGDYGGAETLFKKALEKNPKDAYVNYYLGKTCIKLEKLSEADIFFRNAQKIDPTIPGLSYEVGVLKYKTGNYRQALDDFVKVIAEDPSDVLALYHAGVSCFMIEDYPKALDYLAKSSEMSPSVKVNADYYAGICHYKLADYDKAIEKLDYVSAHAETGSLKKDADMWLQIIKAEKSREKPYYLYVKAGAQYDDNVTLAPVNSDIISDESDVAAVGYLTGRYKLVDRDQFDFGVGYSHYQTVYQDLSQYDLIGALPELYSEYSVNPITFGLSYIPSYYWVDSDSYLMQHQVNPEIRWQIDDHNEAVLSYGYFRNNYFTQNTRDGHANEIGIDLYHGFSTLKGYMFGGADYTDNSASSKDEYYTEASANIGVSCNLFEKTNLTVYGVYYDKQYDYTDSTYKTKRDDSRYFASASITQQVLYDWLRVSAEYSYTNNDSNISEYEYERNAVSLYVAANF